MKTLAQINISQTFGSPFGQGKGINDLVSLLVRGSFVIAGIIIIFYAILGGYQIISGGSSDPRAKEQGKQTITSAVIGFIIVFVAYWIIRLIEVITHVDFITNPGL